MKVFTVKNVNQAFPEGVRYLLNEGDIEVTRAGDAVVAPEPVTVEYESPKQCVLFSAIRDANPFFHMMEAFWLLDGRSQTDFLNYYVKDFGSRFAEQGGHLHGSYGARWRWQLGIDQLSCCIEKLRADPTSRQAFLQMWSVEQNDLMGNWADRPCNVGVGLRIRKGMLDITVFNRSNDFIYGLAGANAVQFSFLQRVLADCIGVGVGRYSQVSHNCHAYLKDLDLLEQRSKKFGLTLEGAMEPGLDPYPHQYQQKIVLDPLSIWKEIRTLTTVIGLMHKGEIVSVKNLKNPYLSETVYQMALSHSMYKRGEHKAAIEIAKDVAEPDWSRAAVQWIERRAK